MPVVVLLAEADEVDREGEVGGVYTAESMDADGEDPATAEKMW